MARLQILEYPDPRLRTKATPVEVFDAALAKQVEDMFETMYAAPGIGLAAPQVGMGLRVIVLDVAREGEPPAPMKLANPEIVWASEDDASYEEGCLSVPEHYAEVERPARVTVRYLDEQNEIRTLQAEGLLATCIQHEMDHLDGILFIDRISALKRNIILRKLVKARKEAEKEAQPA